MRRSWTMAVAGVFGLLAPLGVVTAPAQAQEAEPVLVADFEDGTTQEWFGRGDASVEVSTEQASSGAASLLTTGRADTWQGPGRDVLALLEPGTSYEVAASVRLAPGADGDPEPAEVHLTMQRTPEGDDEDTVFERIVSDVEVSAGEWTTVSGRYSLPATPGTELQLYLESTDPEVSFYIDDVTITETGAPPVQTDIPSLHEVLADEFPLGVAIDQRETTGAPAELLLHHFNSITAENHMKWESIQPEEGEFTFSEADELVEFANENDLRVWGHTLVWHSQTPDWVFEDANGEPLTDSPEDKELLLQRIEDHIRAIADRYGDDIDAWDVVNEVVDESEPDGLRRSRWYEIAGPDYIRHAFEVANEVMPEADLYINDYSTELPGKREAMYQVVEWLQSEGVPVDGVGHQLHVNLSRSIGDIEQTLERFSQLDVDQAVTELDVAISRTSNEQLTEVPQDRLVQQGHYYANLFDLFREYSDELASVSVWGLYDTRSWLRTWPIERMEAPLFFDDDLQAKPAYWGVVDRDELPHLPQSQTVPAGEITVDGERELEWDLLPETRIQGTLDAGFQTRWDEEGLALLVEVADPEADAGDVVDIFVEGSHYDITRDGTRPDTAALDVAVTETDDGYRLEAHMRLSATPEVGAEIPFDLRIREGGGGAVVSWSDQAHEQETDPSRLGELELIEAVALAEVPSVADSAPDIDGEVDEVWDSAARISTAVEVEGSGGATADARLLWDTERLYVLAEVTDPQLDASHADPWQQDSIELFVSPDNAKLGAYGPGDGQYRVNFDNVRTVTGGTEVTADNLTSGTQVVDGGYIVEASVELNTTEPEVGSLLGFELQVNDATDGARTGVTTWYDPTGQSYANTSRWGVLHLVEAGGGQEPRCDETVEGSHRGPLRVTDGTTCLAAGSTVHGPVTVHGGGSLHVIDAKITGPVTAFGAGEVRIQDSRIIGPVTITGATGEVTLSGTNVKGAVTLTRNRTGETPVTVSDNTIKGVLFCTGNRPAPTDDGVPNSVRGTVIGQCARL